MTSHKAQHHYIIMTSSAVAHRLEVYVDVVCDHHLLELSRVGVNVSGEGQGEGDRRRQQLLGHVTVM